MNRMDDVYMKDSNSLSHCIWEWSADRNIFMYASYIIHFIKTFLVLFKATTSQILSLRYHNPNEKQIV